MRKKFYMVALNEETALRLNALLETAKKIRNDTSFSRDKVMSALLDLQQAHQAEFNEHILSKEISKRGRKHKNEIEQSN